MKLRNSLKESAGGAANPRQACHAHCRASGCLEGAAWRSSGRFGFRLLASSSPAVLGSGCQDTRPLKAVGMWCFIRLSIGVSPVLFVFFPVIISSFWLFCCLTYGKKLGMIYLLHFSSSLRSRLLSKRFDKTNASGYKPL